MMFELVQLKEIVLLVTGIASSFPINIAASRFEDWRRKKKTKKVLNSLPEKLDEHLKVLLPKYSTTVDETTFGNIYDFLLSPATKITLQDNPSYEKLAQYVSSANIGPSGQELLKELIGIARDINSIDPGKFNETVLENLFTLEEKLEEGFEKTNEDHEEIKKGLHGIKKSLEGKPAKPDFPWNVPFDPNLNYVGVKDKKTGQLFLEKLHDLLSSGTQAEISHVAKKGISGMGGVGKTQLAIQYVYKYRSEYPGGILWVRGEKMIKEEYGLLARQFHIKIPEKPNYDTLCFEVQRRLNNCTNPGLLVLDNLDEKEDYQSIKPYLPNIGSYRILVTTRTNGLIPGKGIELDVLSEQEALEMLTKESGRSRTEENGKEICRVLGYLPLALELAGIFLSERKKWTYNKYLEELKRKGVLNHRFQNRDELDHTYHIASLQATLSVNDELLANESHQTILSSLCCFAPESINQELLREVSGLDEGDYEDSLIEIKKYSLVRVQHDGRLNIHRLLRQAMPGQLKADIYQTVQDRFVTFFENWSEICKDVSKIKQTSPEIPHLIEMISLAEKKGSEDAYFNAVVNLAWLYDDIGMYPEAKNLLEPLLAHPPSLPPTRHATVLGNLAGVLKAQGQYPEAEKLFRETLDIDKQAYEPGHPAIAIDLGNLAGVLKAQGQYPEAEKLYRQSLDMFMKRLPANHPYIKTTQNNLEICKKAALKSK